MAARSPFRSRTVRRVGAAGVLVAALAGPLTVGSDGPRGTDLVTAGRAAPAEGTDTTTASTLGTGTTEAPTSDAAVGDDPTTTDTGPTTTHGADTSDPGDPSGADETTTSSASDDTTTTTAHDGHDTTTTTGHDGHDTYPPGGEDEDGDGFPDGWTPEQVAYAEDLIARTEVALERYSNPAVLPLLGFDWIADGTEVGQYRHWVNLGWFDDGHILDPDYPESLVFRNTADGQVLQSAMYMLPWRYDLSNIPADIAWLPGWHVHDNLCFDGSGRIVDIADDGVCDVGSLIITPPMVHVWRVDTPCGRFAGVDENGLQCDHDHGHGG